MFKLFIIGCGGFIGAVARYGLSGWVHRNNMSDFPYGTLTVNVIGCLLIGALSYLVEDRILLNPHMRAFLLIGILGAFTTFSTFGYETVELMGDGRMAAALFNVLANVVIGLIAVWIGRTVLRVVHF